MYDVYQSILHGYYKRCYFVTFLVFAKMYEVFLFIFFLYFCSQFCNIDMHVKISFICM